MKKGSIEKAPAEIFSFRKPNTRGNRHIPRHEQPVFAEKKGTGKKETCNKIIGNKKDT